MQPGASLGGVGSGQFGIGMGPGTPGMGQAGMGIGPSNPSMNQGLSSSNMGVQSPGNAMIEAGRPGGNMSTGHMMSGMVDSNRASTYSIKVYPNPESKNNRVSFLTTSKAIMDCFNHTKQN